MCPFIILVILEFSSVQDSGVALPIAVVQLFLQTYGIQQALLENTQLPLFLVQLSL